MNIPNTTLDESRVCVSLGLLVSVCVQVAGTAQEATEVLCLMNMVTKEELEDDEEFEGAASFWGAGEGSPFLLAL